MANFSEKFYRYTVDSLEELKEKTQVGQFIGFYVSVMEITGHFHMDKKTGFVTEKYPFIFRLDDGRTYQWADYLIGKIF